MVFLDMNFSPEITIGPLSQVKWDALGVEFRGRALVIADASLKNTATALQEVLDSRGMNTILFAREGLSCNTETLDEVLSLARGAHARMVVSVGREPVLALGRLTACAVSVRVYGADLMNSPAGALGEVSSGPVLVEVPAAGSYSLLFCRKAPLQERAEGRAVMVSCPRPAVHWVVLDEALIRQEGQAVAELSAVLRLSVAAEAFLSPRLSRFSEVQAVSAVEEAVALLWEVKEEAETPDYRNRECHSLLLSAFACSFNGPGPVQALAWAVSSGGKIGSAAANAVLLPWVLESALYEGSPRARTLAAFLSEKELPCSNPAEGVRALLARLGLPGRLRDLGGDSGSVLLAASTAADMAEKGRADFNEAAFQDILENAL